MESKEKIYWKVEIIITEKEKEILDATEEFYKSMQEEFRDFHAYSILNAIREVQKNYDDEINVAREQLRGTREELAEARKQREEAMKWETDQKFMKSLADENTRLKELVKEAWMAGGAHQSDWHYLYERGDRVTTISLDEWLKSKGI